MFVSSGQVGIRGDKARQEDTVNIKKYSFSPNWGMVLDDNGLGSTVIGTNVSITAYRGDI